MDILSVSYYTKIRALIVPLVAVFVVALDAPVCASSGLMGKAKDLSVQPYAVTLVAIVK